MFRDVNTLRMIFYTVQKSEKWEIKSDSCSQVNLEAPSWEWKSTSIEPVYPINLCHPSSPGEQKRRTK